MYKTSLLLLLFVMLLCVFSTNGYRRYFQETFLEGCPTVCQCNNVACFRNKKGKAKCSTVSVTCINLNFTAIVEKLPPKINYLTLVGVNETQPFDLGLLASYPKLTGVSVKDSHFQTIEVSAKLKRLKYLKLIDNDLTTLPPKNLLRLSHLEKMDLTNNNISSIKDIRFPVNLINLYLNANELTEIPPRGSFFGLQSLEVLKINSNKIERIHQLSFQHLLKLETLELASNKITMLGRAVFSRLPNVWYLDLKNNLIERIHSTAFKLFGANWEGHHQIRLENNHIQYIEENTIDYLIPKRSLYTIYFGGNPIFCDCDTMYLRDKATTLLGDTDRMHCASPRESVGKTIEELVIAVCCGDDDYYEEEEEYYDSDEDDLFEDEFGQDYYKK